MLPQFIKGLNQLIFPNNCLLCGHFLATDDYHQILCQLCVSTIEWNEPPFFTDTHKSKPDFDEVFCACIYNDTMRTLIYRYKYGQKLALRHLFGRLMAEFAKNYRLDLKKYHLLIPIALHPARFRERGYNQAELLAHMLSKKFNIPICSKYLRRSKHTSFQSSLSRKERWTNIEGAFKINPSADISGKNVLIIDDLITTGATCSQAAKELKGAGADRVGVFTLAVADPH